MAHFALLNENNDVVNVIVVSNDDLNNLPFPESEPLGVAFCRQLLGAGTRWAQTSYNGSFRRRFGGIGYTFDAVRDAFIAPCPGEGYVLNADLEWEMPEPAAEAGQEGGQASSCRVHEESVCNK